MSNKITFGTIFNQSVAAGFIVSLIISLCADWFTSIPGNKLHLVFFGSWAISTVLFMSVWYAKKREVEDADQANKKRLADALKANERPRRDC